MFLTIKDGILLISSEQEGMPEGSRIIEVSSEILGNVIKSDGKNYYYQFGEGDTILAFEVERQKTLVERIDTQEFKNKSQDSSIDSCEISIMDITIQLFNNP